MDKKIVFFDGECIVCNRIFHFLLKKDKSQQFYFTTLQSESAKEFLSHFFNYQSEADTIYYYDGAKLHKASSGVLHILKDLSYPYRLMYLFIIIPRGIRDFLYDQFAKRRYQIFGKQACMIPDQYVRSRFIFADSTACFKT